MILSKDFRTMRIGTLNFYHDNGPLPRLIFDPEAIVGLDDTPEIRRDTVERPWSHGNFSDRGFYEARLVTVSGHAVTNTPQELHEMRDQLVYLMRTGEPQWIPFFKGDEGARFIRAALAGRISWKQITDTYAQWKFDLYAADPRIYGMLQSSTLNPVESGGAGLLYPMEAVLSYNLDSRAVPRNLPLSNYGNEEAWPVFKVYGTSAEGFSIKTSRSTITYTGGTSTRTPVVIDTFTGTATYGTGDRSYLLTRRDWMSIPPYGTTTLTFNPNVASDAELALTYVDVEWRSTWM